MPYLMLEFRADREFDAAKQEHTGKEFISFRMIDSDSGKVVELSADATNVTQTERPANFGEAHTASQVLGEEPGGKSSRALREKVKYLESERDSYREKTLAAQAAIEQNKKQIERLNGEIKRLKAKQTGPLEDELIAASLDGYIYDLAASQQWESYNAAKKLYKRLTGMSWSDDGGTSGDDDEEDD